MEDAIFEILLIETHNCHVSIDYLRYRFNQ